MQPSHEWPFESMALKVETVDGMQRHDLGLLLGKPAAPVARAALAPCQALKLTDQWEEVVL
jgi:hypothetical protein